MQKGGNIIMKRKNRTKRWFALIGCLIFCLVDCSTMELKKYPEPSMDSFKNSKSLNGVSVIAQPLLDGEKCEEYFGVNLMKRNILAVFLSVKNDNENVSYTIPDKSIYISNIETKALINNPEKGDEDAGEGAAIAGLLLLSPLLFAVSDQQISDASIIKENFEVKRFRTKTIDPGQSTSGFSYYSWAELKKLDKANICIELIDSIADKSFTTCQVINLRREEQ